MDKTIAEQLDEVFRHASETYIRNRLKSDQDRAEFDAIMQSAAERQQELIRVYEEEYVSRVEETRQRLYDEAAQVKHDHPAPSGVSTNTNDAITRQAHESVQLAHQADLDEALDQTQRDFEDLLERAHKRNETKGRAVEGFLRTTDRRSGQDRRTRNQSQD
jgi:predicted metal-dependent hydrolase